MLDIIYDVVYSSASVENDTHRNGEDAMSNEEVISKLRSSDAVVERNQFLRSLRSQLEKRGTLTERQIAAAGRFLFEANEPLPPAPEGRVEFRGTVLSVKWKDSGYRQVPGNWKATIQSEEGWKVWLTVPAALQQAVGDVQELVGRKVTLAATLTRSDRDRSFAFGKLPSRARLCKQS